MQGEVKGTWGLTQGAHREGHWVGDMGGFGPQHKRAAGGYGCQDMRVNRGPPKAQGLLSNPGVSPVPRDT